jgi:serine/threonine-protein kinase PknG
MTGGLATSATGAGLSGTSTGLGRTTSTRGRTTGRGRLGANLMVVPPVPRADPTLAVKKDPSVPESQRFCSTCGEAVGRGRDGQPGRVEGFCPRDRTRFSFKPQLKPGDLVDRRYEILGAIAHGGLGWIYLARDRNVSAEGADRWVVLKGLINTADPDALAAAVAERRFLVEVDHPNIVKIHDFAEHPDPITGAPVGYIVMEYVGGRSLRDLALANLDEFGKRVPLPLARVLAYGIEVLSAMGYLHDRGLLFCDFKPDNVIHSEEQLKLLDLGAVRRIDDDESALYGTPGYQAPELAELGASIPADLYTVGRALAVLSFEFSGFSTRYASSLPPAAEVPLLAQQESYHRFLLRATHPDRDQRFQSAAEMSEQLTGVLREVLCAEDGVPRALASGQFTGERHAFGTLGEDTVTAAHIDGPAVAGALPLPLVDPTDPAVGFLGTIGGDNPVAALHAVPVQSPEVKFRLVRAHLDLHDVSGAAHELDGLRSVALGDWRVDWYAGLVALTAGDLPAARAAFDTVYSTLPGELAAQLAVAAAAELDGDAPGASNRYARVWACDHNYVSAAFGVARTLLTGGDRARAVAVYDEVPDTSSQHVAAQIAAVRARLAIEPGKLGETDLVDASGRLERLRLDRQRQAALAVEIFGIALAWLGGPNAAGVAALSAQAAPRAGTAAARRAADPTSKVLGQALSERDIRFGLERSYRMLATLERDPRARHALVDQANAVRPRTVV